MNSIEQRHAEIPEVDAAIVEYFADTAFDPRLEKLLAKSDFSQTSFKASLTSMHEIYPEVLKNDRLYDKGDHLEFAASATVTGNFIKDEETDSICLEFVSEANKLDWLRIETDDEGGFEATTSDGNIQKLTSQEVARITLLANDDFDAGFLDTIGADARNDELYKAMIKAIWERAGTLSGYLNDANAITKVIYDSEQNRFIHHQLEHTQQSNVEGDDSIDIRYQMVIPHPELGAEEVYRLSLKYINAGNRLERGVSKIVRSRETEEGMREYNLKSKRITYISDQGTQCELDANDPEVMRIFVDSFDELFAPN